MSSEVLMIVLYSLKPAKRASYTTRIGARDDQPHGCIDKTRVQISAELEDWVQDTLAPKVYLLNGHLGTGKTSIAHTLTLSERFGKSRC